MFDKNQCSLKSFTGKSFVTLYVALWKTYGTSFLKSMKIYHEADFFLRKYNHKPVPTIINKNEISSAWVI